MLPGPPPLSLLTLTTLLLLIATPHSQSVPALQDFFNRILPNESQEDTFDDWAQQNGKEYSSDAVKTYREQVFQQNLAEINAQNRRTTTLQISATSYRLELNKFADLTSQQFSKIYLRTSLSFSIGSASTGSRITSTTSASSSGTVTPAVEQPPRVQAPPSLSLSRNTGNRRLLIAAVQAQQPQTVPSSAGSQIDWRTKGYVSEVKDQGRCGACWAFSVVSTLETLYEQKHGQRKDFSEQQLVDCTTAYNNHGCLGGWMENAFFYVMLHGITQQSQYPYIQDQKFCQQLQGEFKISYYNDVPGNCDAVLGALHQHTLTVAVEAYNWRFYSSGVFDNCGFYLDHAVVLVGANTEKGYWIIKNSWGKDWGEEGYIRLAMGNTCGLCFYTSYPVL